MAKLGSIIICQRAENTSNQGTNAYGIMSSIRPEYVPGLFSFSVLITFLDLDYDNEHTFSVSLVDPNGIDVINIGSIPFPNIQDNSNMPNEHKGLNLSVSWNNVDFKSSGLYCIKVFYDSDEIGNRYVFVKGKNND